MTLIYYYSMVLCLSCVGIGQSLAYDSVTAGPRKDVFTNEIVQANLAKCIVGLPPPAELNMAWVLSVKKWYVAQMNQRDYARSLYALITGGKGDSCLAASLCRTFTLVNETHMTYSHCNGVDIGTSFSMSYKDGQGNEIPGLESWTSFKQNGDKDWTGTSMPVKTDNKTYAIYLRCWEDGTLGYAVLSSRPELPAIILKEIRAYIDDSKFCPWQRITTYDHFSCSA